MILKKREQSISNVLPFLPKEIICIIGDYVPYPQTRGQIRRVCRDSLFRLQKEFNKIHTSTMDVEDKLTHLMSVSPTIILRYQYIYHLRTIYYYLKENGLPRKVTLWDSPKS